MKALYTFALLLPLLAGCANRSDKRLIGRWKENRNLSAASFAYPAKMTSVQRTRFANSIGSGWFSFDGHAITYSDVSRPYPTRITAADSDSVAAVVTEPKSGAPDIIPFYFEGPNRLWVPQALGKLYYDRVSSTP